MEIDADLEGWIKEICPPPFTPEQWIIAMLRGSIAETWLKLTPKGVPMDHMRESVRGFLREGDSFSLAVQKATDAFRKEGKIKLR